MLGLLAGLGLAILVSGGWLAHATKQGNHRLQFAEPVAGLLNHRRLRLHRGKPRSLLWRAIELNDKDPFANRETH
jgi:hypothetical protein